MFFSNACPCFFLSACLFFLSACVTQENYLIKNINFDNYIPINISASDLIIDQVYIRNIDYPYINHLVKPVNKNKNKKS